MHTAHTHTTKSLKMKTILFRVNCLAVEKRCRFYIKYALNQKRTCLRLHLTCSLRFFFVFAYVHRHLWVYCTLLPFCCFRNILIWMKIRFTRTNAMEIIGLRSNRNFHRAFSPILRRKAAQLLLSHSYIVCNCNYAKELRAIAATTIIKRNENGQITFPSIVL